MHGDLGHRIARVQTPRLAPDELAVAVEVAELGGADAGRVDRVEHAQGLELGRRVRKKVDPDAERRDLANRFEDLHVDAALIQRERSREPADSRPCDQYPHLRGPGYPLDR